MKIGVPGPQVLKLHRGDKHLTVACFGKGKPRPKTTWQKNGIDIFRASYDTRSSVLQIASNSLDVWNVSSVLYLRTGGVTYSEAGNYSCEVYNGVDQNETVGNIITVLRK